MIDTVIHNDCLSVLRGMADNSVDAIVSDPPSGIAFMGKEWDNFSNKKAKDSQPVRDAAPRINRQSTSPFPYGGGGATTTKERDNFIAFLREVMTEALRVLKPGGHALIWALPRTSHWTATALEDAGFEVRDKLYHLFGSGFPKSTAIDKQIDKMLGKEREVIGPGQWAGRGRSNNLPVVGYSDENNKRLGPSSESMETKPATPEAQRWQGYGTALKPSCEEWILCRKPLAESSIAAQVLATGTGGLNIGLTRVGSESTIRRNHTSGIWDSSQQENVHGSPQGRFPSHLLLSHSLWCVPRGTKRVRNTSGEANGKERANTGSMLDSMSRNGTVYYGKYEQVEAYDCAPDCPIAELDRQSGVRKSGFMKPGQQRNASLGRGGYHDDFPDTASLQGTYGDTGFASRYFQHFPPDDYTPHSTEATEHYIEQDFHPDGRSFTTYHYFPKASRAERNKGCEDLPEVTTLIGASGHKANPSADNKPVVDVPRQNHHPTVKPLALMRWLIRLITPPDGIVLDPFCGSGSTCVAAIHEGKHFIGIEQDESYVNIANARIAHAFASLSQPSQVSQEYECAPDCPVRILGEQSGERSASWRKNKHGGWQSEYVGGQIETHISTPSYKDEGTAARYFQTFAPDLWTQDMQDAEDVFIAEGGYEGEVSA